MTWRTLRLIAQREARALRRWHPRYWDTITADTNAHRLLCATHGRYVPVGDYDLPDPAREHRRQLERASKKRARGAA